MNNISAFLFCILAFFPSHTMGDAPELELMPTVKLDTVEIVYRVSKGLHVKPDGELVWVGNPNRDAMVIFGDSVLQTVTQKRTHRPLKAFELLERVWWVHGEGGGVLSHYYASAIQNRTYIGIGYGLIAGERKTPSDAARAWFQGKTYNGHKPTKIYTEPKEVIDAALKGDLDGLNKGKTEMGISWKTLILDVADAAIGKGIPNINGWAGDDNRNGTVIDEIATQGGNGISKDATIFIHRSGKWYHAFITYKYHEMFPKLDGSNFKHLIRNI